MKKLTVLPQINKIYNSDCLAFMKNSIPDNYIDLLVCDPPYGYSFMGNDWDTFNEIVEPKGAYQKQMGIKKLPRNKPKFMYENFLPIWTECLRVLKPGAFMFVMSAPRQDTLLEQIRAIKDAGFRTDFTSIYWAYASGFPKAMNIGKMIDKREGAKREVIARQKMTIGIGGDSKRMGSEKIIDKPTTEQAKILDGSYGGFQPKPAVEVIIVAMKPLSEKTYVDQAMKNGKGITWLDDCRMPYNNEKVPTEWSGYSSGYGIKNADKDYKSIVNIQGRFPANLLVSDDVLNDGKTTKSKASNYNFEESKQDNPTNITRNIRSGIHHNDSGSFSRYFDLDKWAVAKGVKDTFPFMIVPKPSKSEKNKGCENLEGKLLHKKAHASSIVARAGYKVKNNHPTVKPIKLMSYLITLGSRKGDIILDPFAGSGTTCLAAKQLGRTYIGIEKEEEYCRIANARLKADLEPLAEAA